MGFLPLWYDYIDVDDISDASARRAKGLEKRLRAAGKRATHQEPAGPGEAGPGGGRRVAHPQRAAGPVPLREMPGADADEMRGVAEASFPNYKQTLDDNRHALPRPVHARRRRAQGRRRRQRRHPLLPAAAPGPGRPGSAVPAGQGGEPARSWRTTCRQSLRLATADGWSRAAAGAGPSRTSSWAGPWAWARAATSTCASSGTGRDPWRWRPRASRRSSWRSTPGSAA